MDQDLTRAETHFAFGRNWAEYAAKITEAEVREAEAGLSRLLGGERLDGKRFLDIGSGSGVHSLAALRLGAREVVAVDIDADSVATTRAVLSRFAPDGVYRIERKSVFDLDPTEWGTFDVVYSWGVLHHTGDLDRALACAARMVAPEGLLVVALYRRIWMDPFWRWEKRWYAQASPVAQARARWVYVTLFRLGLRLTGRRFADYVAAYRGKRGMDYYHDVHDWLGGWPYESISPGEVSARMARLHFTPIRVFARHGRFWGRDPGIFGSGCDEYVYRKI
ncbi:class I SAM-dependent methyltransferase [Pelomicrobium methylotrophicum]|uniref:Class I SAM-dependent methyltransferase n=1 Tax=Pelomicrobium methylotrophicum TaxID=2602750 RepID=A0A5C7EPL0_9PROT|nr:class I SAM-dependent methyltransferase [Pelomicrobium methylotrophicum]TXF13346.1 class I SAM-dependent methyltransferase [Pelomicrobium methylotrophicum]